MWLVRVQIHWLGSTTPELPRYEVHDNALVAVQEPGFVVRGFLWCAAKDEPQLDGRFKEVHKLESCKWPDKETVGIVSVQDKPAWPAQQACAAAQLTRRRLDVAGAWTATCMRC
jgi:hypothetical protein